MASNQTVPPHQQTGARQVILDIDFLWGVFTRESRDAHYIADLQRMLAKASEANQRARLTQNELLERYNQTDMERKQLIDQHKQLEEQHRQLIEQHEKLRKAHIESLALREELIGELSNAVESQDVANTTIAMLEAEIGIHRRRSISAQDDSEETGGEV
ncbi:hypothetical protein D8B26_005345 [Coccidioides posadasii str. Silveira]|uniref:Predicted protein n=1 Tax=Coccidioides posadasii (strain RMSCC 757 / Silveira) TaxID=443226 RepID=E9D503_COCPS|nr:predicted protein [Coccidioides posadasii str. Silveira]QVM10692.1 hypothetical protein D8B26_005345 [Coccidioides posadasii str. Silveira]